MTDTVTTDKTITVKKRRDLLKDLSMAPVRILWGVVIAAMFILPLIMYILPLPISALDSLIAGHAMVIATSAPLFVNRFNKKFGLPSAILVGALFAAAWAFNIRALMVIHWM